MNPKYEVGQEIPVSCIVKITAVQHTKSGNINYSTDRDFVIQEKILEQIEMKPYENPYRATEAQPAQEEPAQPKEPIKLYCATKNSYGLIVGKVYEFCNGYINNENNEVMRNYNYGTLDRLFETHRLKNCLIPLVSRPAKVGEWVYVTGLCTEDYLSGGMKVGDISNVVRLNDNFGVYIRAHKKSSFGLTEDGPVTLLIDAGPQYLVLDGYKPEPEAEPEPEYYNGKVVCVDNGGAQYFEVGKVYCFYDGVIFGANGFYSSKYETLEKANCGSGIGSKFIEFKGE